MSHEEIERENQDLFGKRKV